MQMPRPGEPLNRSSSVIMKMINLYEHWTGEDNTDLIAGVPVKATPAEKDRNITVT
jgi:hypothetical protein